MELVGLCKCQIATYIQALAVLLVTKKRDDGVICSVQRRNLLFSAVLKVDF
jgi:hypothetical protein